MESPSVWFKNQIFSHTLSWKPFGTPAQRATRSKLRTPQLGSSSLQRMPSQWELQAAWPLLPLGSPLESTGLRTSVRSSWVLTDSGRLAAAGVKYKWAPMRSGTASTFQDLIFLVKGPKKLCGVLQRAESRNWGWVLSLPLSGWPWMQVPHPSVLHFWHEREGHCDPETLQLCYYIIPSSKAINWWPCVWHCASFGCKLVPLLDCKLFMGRGSILFWHCQILAQCHAHSRHSGNVAEWRIQSNHQWQCIPREPDLVLG